jgi:pimeloyl-ACP methyl ester carboxylesterase
MAERRRGLIPAGILGALVGAGYGATKLLAASDRRRAGVDREQVARAMEYLAEPVGSRHHLFDSADGGQLHAVEHGPGDATPIVLLHGVNLSSALYHHALADLGDRFRVIALDWRGHGRSRAGRDGYGPGQLGTDVATLLEHLDLTDAVVLGHSMGGMGLGRFAVDHPDVRSSRVSGLVFCDTAAFDVGHLPRILRSLQPRLVSLSARRPELIGKIEQAPRGDLAYAANRFVFGKNPDPIAVEQHRLMLDAMSPTAMTNSLLPLLSHDLRSSLPSVTTPSLVMVGADDRLTPPIQAEGLLRLLSNGRLHTFPDVGHVPMLECREEFARVLAAFVDEVQSAH